MPCFTLPLLRVHADRFPRAQVSGFALVIDGSHLPNRTFSGPSAPLRVNAVTNKRGDCRPSYIS